MLEGGKKRAESHVAMVAVASQWAEDAKQGSRRQTRAEVWLHALAMVWWCNERQSGFERWVVVCTAGGGGRWGEVEEMGSDRAME